jgi:hypothetical protein
MKCFSKNKIIFSLNSILNVNKICFFKPLFDQLLFKDTIMNSFCGKRKIIIEFSINIFVVLYLINQLKYSILNFYNEKFNVEIYLKKEIDESV